MQGLHIKELLWVEFLYFLFYEEIFKIYVSIARRKSILCLNNLHMLKDLFFLSYVDEKTKTQFIKTAHKIINDILTKIFITRWLKGTKKKLCATMCLKRSLKKF